MKTLIFDKALAILGLVRNRDYQVLDFGCGTGGFLGHLSKSIGKGSRLIGCDAMDNSIEQARLNYPSAEFIRHKFIDELPFPSTSFDIFVTIDTIECIKNKKALIEEIHRVLKPEGQVLAMHWDWDTQIYAISAKELARKAVWAFSDWKQPWMDEADGQMGRKLWGLFEGSGKYHGVPDTFSLVETEYKAGQYGYDRARDLSGLVEKGEFDKGEYDRFLRELSDSSAKGEYFYSVTSFIYHGRRA